MWYIVTFIAIVIVLYAIPKILKMAGNGSGRMGDPVDIIRVDLIPGMKMAATFTDPVSGRSMHAGGDRIRFAFGTNSFERKYPASVVLHFFFVDSHKNISKCEVISELERSPGKSIATITVFAPTTLYQEKFLCKAWIVNASFDTFFWENSYAKQDEESAKKWFLSKGFQISDKIYRMD
jgi:hypothetical protein